MVAGVYLALGTGRVAGSPFALHVRRHTVRVTGSALGVRRPLRGMAARARVTLSWDLASRAGGAVADLAVSSP